MKSKKRSIGQKVFSILILMGLVFVIIVVSNVKALKQIETNNNAITDFMELDSAKGDLAVAFQQAQLYANLSYYKQGTDEIDTVRGKLGTSIDNMNAYIDAILEICQEIGDDEIMAGAEVWAQKVDDFIAHCVSIQELVNADQFEDAKPLIDNQAAVKAPAQEAEEVLDELLSQERDSIETRSLSKIVQTNWFNTVSVLIFAIVIAGAVVIVLKTIAKPAQKSGRMLDDIIQKLENNEGDLTERIPIHTKDEIGRMSVGINTFLEQLQGIMQKLKSEAQNMMDSAEKVGKEIVDSNESASNVSATMEEMSASMEEISATVTQMASGSTDVLNAIQAMMKDVGEGMQLVTEIKDRAQKMYLVTVEGKQSTSETMQKIQKALKAAMEESRSVEQINELTGEILSIASQTNLLALNASIEAARAGEAGKGFAVVADEIRNLADSSRDTANNIQTISNEVTNAVGRLAENAEGMLHFIDEKVMNDYDDFVDVVAKYENDAESVNSIITDFSRTANEIENTMEGMNTGLNDIAIAVDESAKGVTMVAESTVELVEAMAKIKLETQANQEISSTLSDEVNRFKKV